jgi:four helix bundle protein
MKGDDLRARTRRFAVEIIRLVADLPREQVSYLIGKQVLRSGTSIGAQCAEAHRSRSDAEFISKLEGALQELEETRYWLEILLEAGCAPASGIDPLSREADELTAILVSSVRTVKARRS